MKKKILLLAFVVLLTQVAVADDHVEFPSYESVDYGDTINVEVVCDKSGGDCPTGANTAIVLCDDPRRAQIYENNGKLFYSQSFSVPQQAKCHFGQNYYAFELKDDKGGNVFGYGGTLDLVVDTVTENLYVMMNVEGTFFGPGGEDGDLTDFRLSTSGNANEGEIIIKEYDSDGGHDRTTKDAKTNYVLEADSQNLNEFLVDTYPSDCPSDGDYDVDDNDICRVATTDFTLDNTQVKPTKCSDGIGCRQGYFDGGDVHYKTNGEVVVGESYNKGGPPSSLSEKKFHTCHRHIGYTHGKTVYSPGDNYEFDQFKCKSDGEWENVAQCGDGVDNDGDGATDLNDPLCDTTSGKTESASTCDPRVGRLADDYTHPDLGVSFSEGRKVAFNGDSNTDFVDSISGCGYSDFEPYVEYKLESPELFRCTENGNIEGYSSSDSEDEGNAVDYWGSKAYCSGLQDIVTSSNWDAHSGRMPVVEYFIEREDIPTGKNKYADSLGFKNKFYDDLSGAELYNYQSVPVDCSNDPNFATMTGCTTTRHNNDSYEPLNMTDLSDGYKSGEYMDSWTFANGAADNSDISSSSYGTVESDSIFSGGFAGKCEEGQSWKYVYREDKWKCSGAVSWTHAVVVPDYTPKESPQTVGIYIIPHNFQKADTLQIIGIDTLNSFSEAFSNANDEDADLTSVTGVCWVGDANDKPAFEDANEGTTWFDTKVSGLENRPDKPVPLFGQLDLTSDSYTCAWGYDVSNSKFYSSIGGPPDLIESSSDERLEDDWFGDGISKSGFDSVTSADAKNQFNTWMDQNAATGRSDPSSYYYDSDHLALN